MGMFDNLKCEYPLPDSVVQDEIFQTKSLECLLVDYTITADGFLKDEKEQLDFHGDIIFYTFTGSREENDYQWFEYSARFTEGKLQKIEKIERRDYAI